MALRLHNTLTNKTEPLRPIDPSRVTMYVCGPTVYERIHIGNARPVVVFDLLYRLLRHEYGDGVRYVRNITDIDDKIIASAAKTGEDPAALAARFADAFQEDISELNALPPSEEPKATQHIPEMIKIIGKLINTGNAYEASGHVLFHVPSLESYGELSNRSVEQMVAGARVEVAPYKRNPADFVLWKPSSPDEPGWDSPWGRGRPGWHLECSAMAATHLGEEIDVHGGGQDLVFPHHENEIAQSRCAHGTEVLARHWVHNGHLTMHGEKMSKSVGNIVSLREMLDEYSGEVVRYALMTGHYRSPLDWSIQILNNARTSLDRLYRSLAAGEVAEDAEPPFRLMAALCDDLATPAALAILHDLATAANKAAAESDSRAAELRGGLLAGGRFLGLLTSDPQQWFRRAATIASTEDAEFDRLVEERDSARARKDYAAADKIRDDLAARGVIVEDMPEGARWRRK